ncbi:MAG: acyl-CoA dehydrogenase [Ardenticatenia bacterium]|nr:MAG: acyl-CoA dehydrogenase [Ardenticatenia bacterium]
MDFSLSPQQMEFKRAVIEFAQSQLNDDFAHREQAGRFSQEAWCACARMGIQGLTIPETYGGMGQDILTATLVMEGLGYACRDNGLIFAINAQMWAVQHPILAFGTEEQKQTYLPPLCRGEMIGAHGMTEPEAGSDAYSLRTTARRDGDTYILNGSKTFVTNAPIADLFIIFASTAPEKGRMGISAFLVPADTPGLTVGRPLEKMGLRTSPMGEVFLDDVRIPAANRLGREGVGAAVFNSSMEYERACILASYVGVMERLLEESIAYARQRKQFGQPIGKFQSVANRIADMKVRLETARLLLYKVAWLKQQGKSAVMEAALAKLYLSEAFLETSLDAVRTFGGYGYMSEYGIEQNVRDALGGVLYSGTSDIQRVVIARLMGL